MSKAEAESETGSDPDKSPLHLVVLYRDEELVRRLLDSGCKVDVEDNQGQTPLHVAVRNKFDKGVEMLLAKQSNVNAQDEDGNTPLLLVYQSQSDETYSDPIEDPYWPNHNLAEVAENRRRNSLCKLLIDHGADISLKNSKGQTLLHWAVFRNIDPICLLILENGGNVNVQDEDHHSPLMIAARKGNYNIFNMLLMRGALVNQKDVKGNYAIHYAVYFTHISMVKMLLRKGAEVDVQNRLGQSALHIAVSVYNCQSIMVELLLLARADVNLQDDYGNTPLHLAVENQRYRNYEEYEELHVILKMLLDWGADIQIRNKAGVTPFDRTVELGCTAYFTMHIVKMRAVKFLNYNRYRFEDNSEEEYEASLGEELDKIKADDIVKIRGVKFKNYYKFKFEEQSEEEYEELCFKELDRMKVYKVGCCSLYDLICNCDDVSFFGCCELDDLTTVFETFPEYGTFLRAQVIKARQRQVLMCGAQKSLNLPFCQNISNKILNLMNNKELECIIKANEKYASHYLILTSDIKLDWYKFNEKFPPECLNIFRAIKKRDIGDLKQCLNQNPLFLGHPEQASDSCLHYAVAKGFQEGVEILLASGMDVNIRGVNGGTPLHCAASIYKYTIANLLINRGADIECENNDGETALHIAVSARDDSIVSLLLEKRCKVNTKNKKGQSPLLSLFMNKPLEFCDRYNGAICDLLLMYGADPNLKNSDGESAFMHAVSGNCAPSICQLLLDCGADWASVDNKNRTPLHVVCYRNKHTKEVSRLLLSRGADVGAADNRGRTPLHLATKYDRIELLTLFIKEGGDVGARDFKGQTVLHYAASSNGKATLVPLVRCLLENGADMYARDVSGKTPLQYCLSTQSIAVNVLIELMDWGGSDIPKHYKNMTPLLRNVNSFKWKFFVRCIIKLQCAKMIDNMPCVFMSYKLEAFQQCCLLELKQMKCKLFSQNSFYDIFSNYSDPCYAINDEMEKALNSKKIESDFPFYSSLLLVTFIKAKKRLASLNLAQELFKINLTRETIRHILSYLRDDELLNLINALR